MIVSEQHGKLLALVKLLCNIDLYNLHVTDYKNIKKEYCLHSDGEYIVTVSVLKNDSVSFYVTPNVKTVNGDTRNLGLLVKKIFCSSQEYKSIELIVSTDPLYKLYDSENTEFESKDLEKV